MKIIIQIKGINSAYLVIENNMINNEKEINQDVINELFRIIRLWKNEYGNSNKLDQDEFYINVDGDIIHGKGVYPNNYKELLDWIRIYA